MARCNVDIHCISLLCYMSFRVNTADGVPRHARDIPPCGGGFGQFENFEETGHGFLELRGGCRAKQRNPAALRSCLFIDPHPLRFYLSSLIPPSRNPPSRCISSPHHLFTSEFSRQLRPWSYDKDAELDWLRAQSLMGSRRHRDVAQVPTPALLSCPDN